MVTRKKKAGYWRRSLADMLHVLLLVDAAQFGSSITPDRPRVEFGDGVAESEQQKATTVELLARAGAVSTATKVEALHPDWNDNRRHGRGVCHPRRDRRRSAGPSCIISAALIIDRRRRRIVSNPETQIAIADI
ncbi:hypothetical protein [Streptomyces violaceusniger]|uniref:hypothetical protein n=1 Tax=Streptomyces violaceusniger TaxID=68280 RepID=UPI003821ED28